MYAASIAILTVGLFAPAPPEKAKGLASIERKLHGTWVGGGDCTGDITLRADGTYSQDRHGPGGATSMGTWDLRWDALPPTLVLNCTASTDKGYVRRNEPRVTELTDEVLVLQYGKGGLTRYKRVKQ